MNSLATAGFTPAVNSTYNNAAAPSLVSPFPTVFEYNQNRLASTTNNLAPFDKGWATPAALTSPLAVGQGYTVHLAGTQKVALTGTLNTGDVAVPLARNAGATAANAGWALVGNPYPAPINWASVLLTDRPGLDAAMYVFESSGPYVGTYRTNVNNLGTSDLIGSSQGFFVRVASGNTSGTLIFRNAHRLTTYGTQVAVRRGTADLRPQVQVRLAGAGHADDLIVYSQAGASADLDSEFDATKLPNPTGLNVAAVAGTGQALAIQGLPLLTTTTVVPLAVTVPGAGTYAFTAPALLNVSANTQVFLTDALTGQRRDLRTLPATGYTFTLTATQAATALTDRFALNLVPIGAALATTNQTLAAGLGVYPNPTHGITTVTIPALAGETTATLTLLDVLGRAVQTQTLALTGAGASVALPLAGLATGVYILKVQAGQAVVTKPLIIN